MSQAGGEKELILGNRQLVSLFFVVVALCGVFFAMGYMVRGNSLKGSTSTTPAADSNAAPADPVKRQQPEQPATTEPAPAADPPPSTAPVSSEPEPAGTRPAQDASPSASAAPISAAAKPEERPSVVTDGGSIFVVQVAALARADAESTARTLREQHLPATVAASSKEGLFRVLVGPYHLTTDVANAKARLKTLGFADTIVQKQ